MAERLWVLSICDTARDALIEAGDAYLERCRGPFAAARTSLKSAKHKAEDAAAADEGRRLLDKSAGCTRVVLDVSGQMLDSEQFARTVRGWLERGRKVAFLLGGAQGHDRSVIEQADAVISLSPMTLPHRLCYALLAEQLYRAQEIDRGGPYHKARRPI